MDALIAEHEKLVKGASLAKGIQDVQKTIDLLTNARDVIQRNPDIAPQTLAKLQNPARQSFEAVKTDLNQIYKRMNNYDKALKAKFKDTSVPSNDNDVLSSQPALINRAIAMHLLREGQFSVASQFLIDAINNPLEDSGRMDIDGEDTVDLDRSLGLGSLKSEALRKQFANMYHILHELKANRYLAPAIAWAREHSDALETRGSNLEFELSRLQYVSLFTVGCTRIDRHPLEAMEYARREFAHFNVRYLKEIRQLAGALAFNPNLTDSPYRQLFLDNDIWDHLANTFTREFCSLLGLSAESPLYIAATAGAIALPTLLKLQKFMKEKRMEWTTQQELPVEILLPPAYRFHSIFVCPVSKEQTTDENPPMMMPCGHVIAQETMSRMSKGASFKCSYCPSESRPEQAKKLYL